MESDPKYCRYKILADDLKNPFESLHKKLSITDKDDSVLITTVHFDLFLVTDLQ